MARELRIKTIEHPDGKARIFIIARDDGLFRYAGEIREWDQYSGFYWAPRYGSGLYETPEAAETDARNEVAWLKHQK